MISILVLRVRNAITNLRLAYYRRTASKLNDPGMAPKTYWYILKWFVNGKKIPLIPPILVNEQLVTNFVTYLMISLFNNAIQLKMTGLSPMI